jgi:hypothetical protein
MNSAIETAIVEQLHRLDEQRQTEVLNFVEYLASKSNPASQTVAWQPPQVFDPMRYSGTVPWPADGLAFQEAARKEWE